MKPIPVLLSLLCLFTLSGCNQSETSHDKGLEKTRAYEGVILSDELIPYAAQVVIEQNKALLTLWDDRDRQTSYLGKWNDTEFSFFGSVIRCKSLESTLVCQKNQRDADLFLRTQESASITDFAGVYQARRDQTLFTLAINGQGELTITGSQCQSRGRLLKTTETSSILALQLNDEDCFESDDLTYVRLEQDNESLLSLNVQTHHQEWPQTWVKQ